MNWDVKLEVVDVNCHLLIDFISFDWDILDSWLRSVSALLFLPSFSLCILGLKSSSLFLQGIQLAFKLGDLLISIVIVKLEFLVLGVGLLKFPLKLLDSYISGGNLLLLIFDRVENVLDLNLNVHADSLLLVDVSIPDLN